MIAVSAARAKESERQWIIVLLSLINLTFIGLWLRGAPSANVTDTVGGQERERERERESTHFAFREVQLSFMAAT